MTLIREDATKAAVLAALPLASHAHFACHGSAASDPLGLDAALLFADDEPASAGEILDLDLAGARLIVASACETGVVAGHDALDEALALSTIFLAAGAGGVDCLALEGQRLRNSAVDDALLRGADRGLS